MRPTPGQHSTNMLHPYRHLTYVQFSLACARIHFPRQRMRYDGGGGGGRSLGFEIMRNIYPFPSHTHICTLRPMNTHPPPTPYPPLPTHRDTCPAQQETRTEKIRALTPIYEHTTIEYATLTNLLVSTLRTVPTVLSEGKER